jgi:tetratricopeptide (TPR) repeat protein
LQGDWEQAHRHFEQAAALSRTAGTSWFSCYPPLWLGWLRLAEGAWEEASRYLEEGARLAERTADPEAVRRAQGLLAERDLLEGHPGAARSRLGPLLGGLGMGAADGPILSLLAWAHLELGELAAAEQVAAQALAQMRVDDDRLDLVDALRVQAMVALRQERWTEAEAALREGLSLARDMPYPYAEARLLQVYGELHLHKAEPEPARERLEAALAIFQRLGARRDAVCTEQALSTLPTAPPPDAAVQAMASTRQRVVAHAPAGPRLSRTERHARAVEHLRTNGPLSPRAYASALAVSLDTALRDLQALGARGVVQAAGTTRNRRYTLVSEDVGPDIHRTAP